jgi:pyrroline-5-carboxylate reductase
MTPKRDMMGVMKATNSKKPLATFRGQLALIGAGKMGGAMLDGWLARGLDPATAAVVDPQPGVRVRGLAKRGLKITASPGRTKATVAVVAVKPQDAASVMATLKPIVRKSTLVVSIMAGRTLGFLQDFLPAGTPVVRAMPNLPAAIGRGVTVAVGNRHVAAGERKLATELLAACGVVEWVNDEKLLDAVTAVSGSGPAYVFLLAETLAGAATAAGLPHALAARLARETIAGSGELLRGSKLDAATLRKNVTSPGGTTAAALDILMGPGGFETLLETAVARATRRSRELAG